MRSIKTCACVVLTVLGLVAPAMTVAPAIANTRATVVYGFGGSCPPTGWRHPMVRPSRAMFDLACEDGIKKIRWSSWRASSAFGHGVHLQFNGFGFIGQPATISLSEVRTHNGQRYFSHLVMRWTTRTGRHMHEVFNWRHIIRSWAWI